MYGTGISWEGDVLDLGVEHKAVQKSGAWYSYGDQRLGQGRENVKQFLRENPDITQAVRADVIKAVNPQWMRTEEPAAEPADATSTAPETAPDKGRVAAAKSTS